MKGKQLHTTAECYQALLDGEKLCGPLLYLVYCCLDKNGNLIYNNGTRASQGFGNPTKWYIYEEPKWYENIPEGGVLCYVTSSSFHPSPCIDVIYRKKEEMDKPYLGSFGREWRTARPLSREEIQTLLGNAQ